MNKTSRSNEKPKDIRKEIYNRSLYLYYIFLAIGLIIVGRMLYIQYSAEGYALREEGKGYKSFGIRNTPAKRGNILSFDNRILATTIPLFHIHMDFAAEGLPDESFREGVDSLAICLSAFFKDKTPRDYRDSLIRWHAQGLRYKRITPRRVNYIELKEVSSFPILRRGRNRGGMLVDTLQQRVFPHGDLARRTIGRVNESGALYGIERSFNDQLKGIDGKTAVQKISGNFWMPIQDESNIDPIDGYDIVSTIDIDVQDVAETMLKQQLIKHDALWGTAILMEVNTGEIRAIANLAKNESDSITYIENYNYAIGSNLEPGSTFKLVSLMTLLDDAKANINEIIDTEDGTAYIGSAKVKVSDTKRGGYGKISLRRVFEVSSNIGFAKAVNKYYADSPEKFTDYLYKLGINKPFELQLEGEAEPVIRKPGDRFWNGTSLTMMSFGYALMLSPIHTLALYNAIANDGKYMKPLFVTEIREKGTTIQNFEPEVITEQICSPSTLRFLKESLEGVVNDGTAAVLRNKYYKVAGKTGTAQVAKGSQGYIVNGGRYYLASIVGYFPADNPKYSCIVAIETFHPEGSNKVYYGGSLSGPVFRAIADKVYSQSPQWEKNISRPKNSNVSTITLSENTKKNPLIKGGSGNHISEALHTLSVKTGRNINNREFVTIDSSLFVHPVTLQDTTIPDVRGMALRDALIILEQKGIHVFFQGKGSITEQFPAPYSPFVKGDTVRLLLK